MADTFNSAIPNLLCEENGADLDFHEADGFLSPISFPTHVSGRFKSKKSGPVMAVPLQSEEIVKALIEQENWHLPTEDYLKKLRNGDSDLSARREALDWMWKAQSHHGFGSLCVCLSLNYLDRFLSISDMPRDKSWTVQLIAVACLSIAAKMDETYVPKVTDLQAGEPKFLFNYETIKKMELLVMDTLQWRMRTITAYSFVDYFYSKVTGDQHPSGSSISALEQVILSTTIGIDFLGFRPSEIAAAAAVLVSLHTQAMNTDTAMTRLVHVDKERVFKCLQLMKNFSLANGNPKGRRASASSSLSCSPVCVLEAACLSHGNDEANLGSCPTSSHNDSLGSKRRWPS